jgi:chorismate mutase
VSIVPLQNWFPHKTPLLIAGPCSAESPEQLLASVKKLKESGVHIFRAGAWKPRTRPNAFEGRGAVALSWIKDVSNQIKLPAITEVANPHHVEDALKAGIDMLWIGARTTVNPFLIQEIADSLNGVDIPVFVKNPVNPDVDLWLGALERFNKAGITKLAAIHRGFSSYENHLYRNKPHWEIAIELRRKFTGIPLICDSSHICGSTSLIHYISQVALDLQYNGLMIEVHANPPAALSDAKQQLTPEQFNDLVKKLIVRSASVEDAFELSKLEDLRDQIDEIDAEIIDKLAHRMSVARVIGKYKKKNNVAILQPERWEEILRTRTKSGMEKQLTREFLISMLNIVHQESIYQQTLQMSVEDKNKIQQ